MEILSLFFHGLRDTMDITHSGVSICKRSFDQLIIIIREYEDTNNMIPIFTFSIKIISIFLAHIKIVINIYIFSDCT